ncbi:MAG: hypothetical protein ABWZ40_04940 [Caulobacterales bacterium]
MFKEEFLPEHLVPVASQSITRDEASSMWEKIPDPSPELATSDPDKLLTFLFCSPRPCSAVEALFDND